MIERGRIPGILGAILVGGESRRMGRDKALLELGGVTLLERAARVAAEVFADLVVCGDPDRYARFGLETVADNRSGVGPLAGLETALARAAGRPVFVLACDLARVGPELIQHVHDVATPDDPVTAPSIDGSLQPLCALYRPTCRGPLAAFLDSGERRAVDFFDRVGGRRVALGAELPFFSPDLLANVNRPDDLARLRSELPAGTGAGR